MPTTNPKYDGSDSGPIDLATALQWMQNFRSGVPPNEVRSHYFGRNIIDKILAQPGCTGLRISYARNDKGEKELIIAGVEATGNNQSPATGNFSYADFSWPCPPWCPTNE